MTSLKRVCVYCGSREGSKPAYARAARDLGAALARRGIGLVYGGGRIGLMGVVADAVLAEGGSVTGVIPRALVSKEVAHLDLKDLRVVGSMHERKALMAELSDAFIALPGGFGTLEEFSEVLTWAQLGLHAKPIGILNVGGYFDPLLAWLNLAVKERFLKPVHRRLLLEAKEPQTLLDLMQDYRPRRNVGKWLKESDL